MVLSQEEKKKQMRKNFGKLDENGDGTLDYDELKVMLIKGNPTFTESECKELYRKCDTNGDGKISFEEFLDYIYRADKTDAGRHGRLAAASKAQDDGTETDWGPCHRVFEAFAGKDMDGKEFMKFCKDSKLIGKGVVKTDVDIIFAKVVPKGQRRMDFNMFKDSCRLLAGKRGQKNSVIQAMVADSNGPEIKGTEAEAVRFYDDKSTYTGAAAQNTTFAGVDHTAALGRHEKMQEEKNALLKKQEEEEDPWDECERVFNAFAGDNGTLESKEFYNMCLGINGLQRGNLKKEDIDVVFSACAPQKSGLKSIKFEHFKACVREIALKKDEPIHVTQSIVARSKGPTMHGTTKAGYNKFHDDKNLYTGTHADNLND